MSSICKIVVCFERMIVTGVLAIKVRQTMFATYPEHDKTMTFAMVNMLLLD